MPHRRAAFEIDDTVGDFRRDRGLAPDGCRVRFVGMIVVAGEALVDLVIDTLAAAMRSPAALGFLGGWSLLWQGSRRW